MEITDTDTRTIKGSFPVTRSLAHWQRPLLKPRHLARGDDGYQQGLEAAVQASLVQAGLHDLPVLSGLDFGHTQPMLTLPSGVAARIDCTTATLTIVEVGVC
jgi:hypothetical protein